jgi:hypothetical protein
MSSRATRIGAGISWDVSSLGTGSEIETCEDLGLGDAAIIVRRESSAPRGWRLLPILVTGTTSGTALRRKS